MKTLGYLAIAAVLAMSAQTVLAQRDAASKITGSAYEAPYFYSSGGAYQDNAYSHVRVLQDTAVYGQPVPPAVVQEHATAVRKNLAESKKYYAKLRETLRNNKTAVKHLDTIESHHQKVLTKTDELESYVAKGHGDADKVHASAKEIHESLKSAKDEHGKLLEHVKAHASKPPEKK